MASGSDVYDNAQPTNTALASLLDSRLQDWERSRKPQELKMLECYQDVMRIPREDDTQGTGAAKSRKAKSLFIGSTRNKVRAARAKIIDALFGAGNMPFDTTPTDETMAPYADVMEDIITEQMERGKFKDLLKTGVNTLATYGTGFIFGPFIRNESITETKAEQLGKSTALTETKYEFQMPYFELGNTLDVYPDPEAREIDKGLGVFWVTMESPHTVAAWKSDKAYKNITQALQGAGDRGNETGSDMAQQLRSVVDYWFKNERIKVARFFGKVPKSAMGDQHGDTVAPSPEEKSGDLVDAIVIMAGGVVVKVDENPYGGKNPTHRCLYEAVEHEIWGVGVAENNAPHQKVTNAAFRLFMEGKGMALLGTTSVDRSKFLPSEDFKKFPGKVYQFKPGLSPDDRKEALIQHIEPDITGGWIDVIRMSEQFSDDDTGITKYTQGDDAKNLNKTATGISMIMSASSLPMKEVIQNIDSQWIEPIVECYIDWNLKYLEPETVFKIHGQEAADLWALIKQHGKSSFMDWQATGTASFMQKEVLTNKIRAFAEFALGNPVTAPLIDAKELLQQTWDVMEIGKESPVLKDENGEADLPEPVKARMMEVSQHVEQLEQQAQQMQQALQQAGMAAQQAEQEKIKADIQAKEAISMLEVQKAEALAVIAVQKAEAQALGTVRDAQAAAQQPQQQAAQPSGQQSKQPLLMLGGNGEVTEAMAPMAEMMSMQGESTQAALSALAQAVQQSSAQTVELMQQMLAEIAKPRKSTLRIAKQKDGSFAGEKVEYGEQSTIKVQPQGGGNFTSSEV